MLELALVGTGGMMPLPGRWLSSVLIRWESRLILFDCGEGTQISLRALGWGIKRIGPILLSHLHGDHVGGLPGLLLTLANAGRVDPLDIYGPPGLEAVVTGLCVIARRLPYRVLLHEIDGETAFAIDKLRGSTTYAQHSVPCLAYRLDLSRRPQFIPERARALGIPIEKWSELQGGKSVEVDGEVLNPADVCGPDRTGLAIGLVTDTRPTPAITRLVDGVDVLVCEAMYGLETDRARALERSHMTFAESAQLALSARARQLLLTHFSPSLTKPDEHGAVARCIFPNTIVGRDHLVLSLAFSD